MLKIDEQTASPLSAAEKKQLAVEIKAIKEEAKKVSRRGAANMGRSFMGLRTTLGEN